MVDMRETDTSEAIFTIENADGDKVKAVTVSNVAQSLQMSVQTIYQAIEDGAVPAVRVAPRMIFVPLSFVRLVERLGWSGATGRRPGPKGPRKNKKRSSKS